MRNYQRLRFEANDLFADLTAYGRRLTLPSILFARWPVALSERRVAVPVLLTEEGRALGTAIEIKNRKTAI